MEITLEVCVPGPWWHALTYRFDRPLPPGVRVKVPVGRGHRVGFVAPDGPSPPPGQGELKEIEDVLDGAPPLGEELGRLASWIGINYLCGTPLALGRIAPGFLLRGQGAFQEDLPVRASSGDSEDAFVFDPRDDRRWGRYREEIGGVSGGILALFGEQSDAARFWDLLPDRERGRGILWPSSGGRALQRAWEAVRSGERSLVVGGRGALFAPLRDLRLVVVDEEASGGHRFVDPPFLHARTVASQRARLWRSRFLAGGRMPSARLFRMEGGEGIGAPGGSALFRGPPPHGCGGSGRGPRSVAHRRGDLSGDEEGGPARNGSSLDFGPQGICQRSGLRGVRGSPPLPLLRWNLSMGAGALCVPLLRHPSSPRSLLFGVPRNPAPGVEAGD